ncbi:MAG: EF-hand domain-containing protein [Undibacterium sp.]|uniref:EF-hand domain-containing protein n=1 Tax=Undibacterium sp. TaxID=1914977 RepID=UPI0027268FDB|nr:EF-hand domain-containing protein [Undibacterium sp.]MDO8653846.1 EF-hand domain-containing protein [Undibacterium sp.]
MSMSISSVGRGSSNGVDASKMASMMATKMMSDLDPNNTGKVSKDQFVSGLTAKGVSSDDATKMYDSIDTKKTGSIGKSDIETSIKNGNLKPPSGGSRAAGDPGGSGKSGGGQGGVGGVGGASSSSTTYAAADTNQDGAVSGQEDAVYVMKHPSASSAESNKTDPSKLGKNVDQLV